MGSLKPEKTTPAAQRVPHTIRFPLPLAVSPSPGRKACFLPGQLPWGGLGCLSSQGRYGVCLLPSFPQVGNQGSLEGRLLPFSGFRWAGSSAPSWLAAGPQVGSLLCASGPSSLTLEQTLEGC